MKRITSTGTRGGERGNVMVGALLMLLLISAMGISYVALSKTETGIAGSEQRHVQSMYNAEAGIGEALMRMSSDDDTTTFIGEDPDSTPTPGWGVYLVQTGGSSSSSCTAILTCTWPPTRSRTWSGATRSSGSPPRGTRGRRSGASRSRP